MDTVAPISHKPRCFDCVKCGACCQGWKIPLCFEEAIAWATRGHGVEVLVRGFLVPTDSPAVDTLAAYTIDRSFSVRSGAGVFYVQATFVGAFHEKCPHLMGDNRCAIYAERPRVCRIYPAEVNPFVNLDINNKKCPPESWQEKGPEFMGAGQEYAPVYDNLIRAARQSAVEDVPFIKEFCKEAGIQGFSLIGEGFVVYTIGAKHFLSVALNVTETVRRGQDRAVVDAYTVLSNRTATRRELETQGIVCAAASQQGSVDLENMRLAYLGYFQDA